LLRWAPPTTPRRAAPIALHTLLLGCNHTAATAQADDQNYVLALDFCLQKAYYHSFPNTRPREVEAFYTGCVAGCTRGLRLAPATPVYAARCRLSLHARAGRCRYSLPPSHHPHTHTLHDRLAGRLREDAQPSKAAALYGLSRKLLALPLAGAAATPDLNHALLALLAALAGRPLESELQETPVLLALLYQPAATSLAPPAAAAAARRQRGGGGDAGSGAAGGDGDDDCVSEAYDPYGDASSLSDWGADSSDTGSAAVEQAEEEEEEQQPQAGSCDAQVAAPAAAQHPPEQTAGAAALLQQQISEAAQWQLLHPGAAAPDARCLLAKLQLVRPAAQQQQQQQQQHAAGSCVLASSREHCFTEGHLAAQVLQVLQGLPADGFRLAASGASGRGAAAASSGWQPAAATTCPLPGGGSSSSSSGSGSVPSMRDELVPDARTTTPCLSPHALRGVLAEAAAAGTQARQLRALVLLLAAGSGGSSSTAAAQGRGLSWPVTPCLRALGVALQQQLDTLGMQLAALQQQLQARGAAGAGACQLQQQLQQQQQRADRGQLLWVAKQARPAMRRLHLLHSCVFGVLEDLTGPPAAVSAALIDGLAAQASAAAQGRTGPQGCADASALLHLLLSACVPLVGALSQWLHAGDAAGSGQPGTGGAGVCPPDFFIARVLDVPAIHPSFWHSAYSFLASPPQQPQQQQQQQQQQRNGAAAAAAAAFSNSSGGVQCPAFLLPLAGSIMAAGKGSRLLEHLQQEDLHASSLCRVTPAAAAAAVVQQQCALAGRSGALPAVASRPASAGGVASSARLLPRQLSSASSGGRPGHRRSSSDGGGLPRGRRQWSRPAVAATTQQQAPPGSAALAAAAAVDVSRQVRLQLAAAAAVAGRQQQDVLAHGFISNACALLRSEQQMLQHARQQRHGAQGDGACGVLATRLVQAGEVLAHPAACSAQAAAWPAQQAAGAEQALGCISLRDALSAAKARRLAAAGRLGGPRARGTQAALAGGGDSLQQQTPLQAADGPTRAFCGSGAATSATHAPGASTAPPAAHGDGACAPASPAAAPDVAVAAEQPAAAVGSPDVPRLMAWRDQLQGRLDAAGQQLQQMAPWSCVAPAAGGSSQPGAAKQRIAGALQAQPALLSDQDMPCSSTSSSKASSNLLLVRAAGQQVPGRFTGSLAEVWPLAAPPLWMCGGAAPCADADADAAHSSRHSSGRLLGAGRWPGEQLAWLLRSPPQQLPALEQLLDVALLQPLSRQVRTRMLAWCWVGCDPPIREREGRGGRRGVCVCVGGGGHVVSGTAPRVPQATSALVRATRHRLDQPPTASAAVVLDGRPRCNRSRPWTGGCCPRSWASGACCSSCRAWWARSWPAARAWWTGWTPALPPQRPRRPGCCRHARLRVAARAAAAASAATRLRPPPWGRGCPPRWWRWSGCPWTACRACCR
jgi:hypothetical protein